MSKSEIIEKGSLEKVSATTVLRKFEDTYYLNCQLYKRGNKNVTYHRGDNFLMGGRLKFFLSDNAVADVEKEIAKFDEKVQNIISKDSEYRVVRYSGTGITLYYRRKDNNLFDSLTLNEFFDEKNIFHIKKEYILREDVTARHILALSIDADYWYRDIDLYITKHNLHNHPLYQSALDYKDDYIMSLIEVLYGSPGKSAINFLEKTDGVRRLPRLSKAFDKTYTVLREEVDDNLLINSGYVFLHRPNFAMVGSQRKRCELNPYAKISVDAGLKDAELISFKEFLELFNDHNNWNRND